jgi:glycosyltransferase involved in cell wall biosynthesis
MKLIRSAQYSVIHAVEEAAFIVYLLKWYHRLPYIVDMDSNIPNQISDTYPWIDPFLKPLRFLERKMVQSAMAVLAVSEELARLAREAGARCPVHVIEDASLLDMFPGNNTNEKYRDVFNIRSEQPIVLYVGNLHVYQGIDLLLEAFSRMTRPGALVIVGGDENHIKRYQQKVQQLDLDDRVFWVGQRPLRELSWHLKQADILISPRLFGVNTPMKIYSYLASGIPIVATDIPSHTQVLDSEVAVLTRPEPDAVARALDQLAGSKDLRESIGTRAKELGEKKYSREAFSSKVEHFYQKIEELVVPCRERS